MKRRAFLNVSAGTAAVLSGTAGCKIEKIQTDRKSLSVYDRGGLAGLTLEELSGQYKFDLFDDFLPFMDKYVIDHEYGGFMCNTDRDGTNVSTDKGSWYEGRGIWVYSFLYNKVDPDPKHLEVARKSVEFILKHKPSGNGLFTRTLTKEGKALAEAADVYGDLFIANGLAEYSQIPGNEKYWDLAKELLFKCIRIYDSSDYRYDVYYGPDAPTPPAPRVLGHWMVIIRLVTQMLEHRPDPDVEAVARRTVDAIMNYHFNPEYRLFNEVINHDMSRTDYVFAQFSYTGHAIETLWMVMYEAVRLKDRQLFDDAAERFKRHIEVSWDDVYGGAFRCLDHVDNNIWKTDKVLWLQEEILIGTLFIIEHTGAQWAKDWFSRMFEYVQDKFPLKQYGFPLWILGADRKVTFVRNSSRIGNFHHPRHLMLNLMSIERMIDRDGRTSGIFEG